MKVLKISLAIILPASVAFCAGYVAYLLAGRYVGQSHDVYVSNVQNGLIPIISVCSLFLVFLPALFYMSALLFAPVVISEQVASKVSDQITTQLHVGQIIEQAGTNCKLRVKAVKNMFAALQEDQYNYILSTQLY